MGADCDDALMESLTSRCPSLAEGLVLTPKLLSVSSLFSPRHKIPVSSFTRALVSGLDADKSAAAQLAISTVLRTNQNRRIVTADAPFRR